MKCPSCSHENPEGAKPCLECGRGFSAPSAAADLSYRGQRVWLDELKNLGADAHATEDEIREER